MAEDSTHYIEDLEERENASHFMVTTLAIGEETGEFPIDPPVTTQACFETGC